MSLRSEILPCTLIVVTLLAISTMLTAQELQPMSKVKPVVVYPQSTNEGASIPLEIALPIGALVGVFSASGLVGLSNQVPDSYFYSAEATEDCILDFRATNPAIVNNVYTPGLLYVSAGTTIVYALEGFGPDALNGNLAVWGLGKAGKVYIQAMAAWGILNTDDKLQVI